MHKRVESGSAGHLQGKDHLDEGLRCRGPTSGTLRPLRAVCRGAGASNAVLCPHRTRLHIQPLSAAWLQMDLGTRVCQERFVRPGPPTMHWAVVPQSPGFSPLQGASHTWFSSHQGGPHLAEGMGTRDGARREGRDALGKGQEVSPKTAGAETGPEKTEA